MDSPEQWRWIWLAATAVFAIGEMATPGSFFLAPFAVGALVASILAFAGVSVLVEWIVFIVVSVAVLALLRPLARRLDRDALDHGVGSRRLIGRQATVLRTIPAGDEIGMVRVDREQWRAQSIDGTAIAEGIAVRIADVQGTRVIVAPMDPLAAPATTLTQPRAEPAGPSSSPTPSDLPAPPAVPGTAASPDPTTAAPGTAAPAPPSDSPPDGATPDAAPPSTSSATPDAAPPTTSSATPDAAPPTTSSATPDATPPTTSSATPDATSSAAPDSSAPSPAPDADAPPARSDGAAAAGADGSSPPGDAGPAPSADPAESPTPGDSGGDPPP